MSELNGFYAYPSQPVELGKCIEKAADEYNRSQSKVHVNTWAQLDVIGQFISTKVLKTIDDADFLIADITNLNFNVTYEIGFFVTSCGFGLIEQAAHRAANQVDHGDEVSLVPIATCA